MDKFENILRIMWNIVKLIYITLLIIIGVRLILLFIMPISIFSFFPYSPFDSYDWNPCATLVGAIITAIVTFCAVYLTALQDRNARKFENAYKSFINNLISLNDSILEIEKMNNWYIQINDGDGHEIDYDEISNNINTITKVLTISKKIQMFSPKQIDTFRQFDNWLIKHKNFFDLLRDKLKNHIDKVEICDYFKETFQNPNKVVILHKIFVSVHKFDLAAMDRKTLEAMNDVIKDYLNIGK